MELGIYIHIPFCVKKCYYCDFVSYTDKSEYQGKYIKRIIKEIKENKDILEKSNITTIYIGGGTPSSIDEQSIREILQCIYNNAKMSNSSNCEITIEVNPGTVTYRKLDEYRQIGINRLSIGLQSANDELLRRIGRVHNFQQFLNTYELAKEAGFENINVDLMLGLPNQTVIDLRKTLEEIIKLNSQHVSIYSLIVEENTKIEKMINDGAIILPEEDEERNQYSYAKNFLELNGFKHYEISNFAKTGFESRHNMNCWEQKQYIGFGLAAHSYLKGYRYSNTSNLQEYINSNSKDDIQIIHEQQSMEDMRKEYMLLGLRKIDGVDISKFKNKFTKNPIFLFRKELDKLVNDGLVVIDCNNIKLTRKGLDFANLVWEQFI